MLWSDWLSHRTLLADSVQRVGVADNIATFSPFSEVLEKKLQTNGRSNPREDLKTRRFTKLIRVSTLCCKWQIDSSICKFSKVWSFNTKTRNNWNCYFKQIAVRIQPKRLDYSPSISTRRQMVMPLTSSAITS